MGFVAPVLSLVSSLGSMLGGAPKAPPPPTPAQVAPPPKPEQVAPPEKPKSAATTSTESRSNQTISRARRGTTPSSLFSLGEDGVSRPTILGG